jgi:hypothetical protein
VFFEVFQSMFLILENKGGICRGLEEGKDKGDRL